MSALPANAPPNLVRDAILGGQARPGYRVLIRGGMVLSLDDTIGDLPSADLLINGSAIEAIGVDLGAAVESVDAVVDARGMIVMPGFQDTHRHSWQGQFRRLMPDVDVMMHYGFVAHGLLGVPYRPEDIEIGTLLTDLSAIDSGITTVLDFFHNPRSIAHVEASVAAHEASGLRSVIALQAPLVGDRALRWPEEVAGLASMIQSSPLRSARLGLSGVPNTGYVDTFLNAEHVRFARQHGLGISADAVFGRESGDAVLELDRLGLLGPNVELIHCLALGSDAWKAISGSGTRISISPIAETQMGVASAVPAIHTALTHGVQPSLSADVEVVVSGDMFSLMRVSLAFQRMLSLSARATGDESGAAPISTRDVLRFATKEGAATNGLAESTGTLTPGKQADLLLLRTTDINVAPLNNAAGSIVSGADSRNVDTVFIAGRLRKWGGAVLGYDHEALLRRLEASRSYLFERGNFEFDVFQERLKIPDDMLATMPWANAKEDWTTDD